MNGSFPKHMGNNWFWPVPNENMINQISWLHRRPWVMGRLGLFQYDTTSPHLPVTRYFTQNSWFNIPIMGYTYFKCHWKVQDPDLPFWNPQNLPRLRRNVPWLVIGSEPRLDTGAVSAVLCDAAVSKCRFEISPGPWSLRNPWSPWILFLPRVMKREETQRHRVIIAIGVENRGTFPPSESTKLEKPALGDTSWHITWLLFVLAPTVRHVERALRNLSAMQPTKQSANIEELPSQGKPPTLGDGGFHKWGYPKMVGFLWKIPLK